MMHRVAERSGQPRQSLDAANADALNELATLATTLSSLSSTQTDGLESPTLSSSITFLRNINAFLPISRLPSEILICVLELSTSHSRRKSGTIVPSDRLMELYTLMKLTHICHHWREVAINRQSLWAHLSSWMPQELIDLFLERAGDGPFNIRVSQFPDRLLNSLGTRARTLYLTYPTPYLSSDKLLEYLAFPAPQLEFLTVHQTGLRQSHIQAEVKASPELFSGGALRLRVLSLNRTRWLPYNCCQNLTRLYLHPDGTPAWSLRDLIAFLQGCPKLHTFSLTRCSWPDSSDDLHSPFVRLASLRMLYLGLPSKATSSLSRCLVLPTPSSVYIRTMDNARGDYASFDGCSRLLPRGDFERLHCSYTALGYSSIELVVTVAGAAHVITAEVVPVPELGMSKMGIEEDDRGTCHIWPSALLENLDVQEVRELWIEACFSGFPGMLVASPTWYAGAGISDGMLESLASVTTLYLIGDRPENWLPFLMRLCHIHQGDILLPKLETLHVWTSKIRTQLWARNHFFEFIVTRAQLGCRVRTFRTDYMSPHQDPQLEPMPPDSTLISSYVDRFESEHCWDPPALEIPHTLGEMYTMYPEDDDHVVSLSDLERGNVGVLWRS